MNRLNSRSVGEYQFSDWRFIKWLKSRKNKTSTKKTLTKSHKDETIENLQNELNNKNVQLSKLSGQLINSRIEQTQSNKLINELVESKRSLEKDNKIERKRGDKFKKLAIGLGIGAGATAIGAGILGSKYIGNKRRMNSMNNTISRLSKSWIGRHALKRANR